MSTAEGPAEREHPESTAEAAAARKVRLRMPVGYGSSGSRRRPPIHAADLGPTSRRSATTTSALPLQLLDFGTARLASASRARAAAVTHQDCCRLAFAGQEWRASVVSIRHVPGVRGGAVGDPSRLRAGETRPRGGRRCHRAPRPPVETQAPASASALHRRTPRHHRSADLAAPGPAGAVHRPGPRRSSPTRRPDRPRLSTAAASRRPPQHGAVEPDDHPPRHGPICHTPNAESATTAVKNPLTGSRGRAMQDPGGQLRSVGFTSDPSESSALLLSR